MEPFSWISIMLFAPRAFFVVDTNSSQGLGTGTVEVDGEMFAAFARFLLTLWIAGLILLLIYTVITAVSFYRHDGAAIDGHAERGGAIQYRVFSRQDELARGARRDPRHPPTTSAAPAPIPLASTDFTPTSATVMTSSSKGSAVSGKRVDWARTL